MILKKTYMFDGVVRNAKGMMKGKVIGKKVRGEFDLIGDSSGFLVNHNNIFRLTGKITEAPMVTCPLSTDQEYPFVMKTLDVEEHLEFKEGSVSISLNIIPWSKLDNIRIIGSPNGWAKKMLLSCVQVDGVAILLNSEEKTGISKV